MEVKKEVVDDGEVKQIGEIANCELIMASANDWDRYTILKLLEQKQPSVIVLYTMNLQTLRQIELYRACNPKKYLQVYCLQYLESTEESRYLESINRETLAFEALIREQGTLMIAREFNVEREEPPKIKTSTRDGGGDQDDPENIERPKVIVDMREFNSELPTVLYTKGYDVVAATLEVGDYILSTNIAVERKALDDLTQSLQSGRVFKQIEQMLLHYECSVLLVESSTKFETKIVNGGPFQGELSRHCREVRSRLCALIRAHPNMRIIWSMSPTNSAELFIELKLNSPEPDVDKAVSLKVDQVEEEEEEEPAAKKRKEKKKRKANPTLVRALSTHLDLRNQDVQKFMVESSVTNLAELFSSKLSYESISEFFPQPKQELIKTLATFDFSKK
ncbi:unnamed protein product [Caenorhabditis bovis]|uniref:DNA repair endonuclease XPF n=1 Tax=Caenorhabditis bovis TaxID=2654633 RepID=A0A8S1EV98_9PELO|nr:unnamed protein product [Caenorhabditis bovis]CAB3403944.1 unnamed protein product [Caenorhabditis bovis]